MRWAFLLTAAGLLVVALGSAAEDQARDVFFGKDDVGKVPAGWKADRTGKGEGSVWNVVEDPTAPSGKGYALAQTAEGPSALFNLCVLEGPRHKDVEILVAFKAVKGKLDQGGGIVWRYQDADNYYIARMNPLESNYRVYKVVDGKRTQLETREGIRVSPGAWHRLKVKMTGDKIECFLDDQKELTATDTTFPGPGKVGLWTKADAQTYFDAFKVRGK
jgi:hypothetical protein